MFGLRSQQRSETCAFNPSVICMGTSSRHDKTHHDISPYYTELLQATFKKEEEEKKKKKAWVTATEFLNSQIKGNKKSTDEKLNDSDEEKLVDCVPLEFAFWFETL